MALLLTCEHAGNQVPKAYAACFAGQRSLLDSHRGWDPGTLALGKFLSKELSAPLIYRETTRLLVDLNRSESNRSIFSSLVRELTVGERNEILERYFRPYRREVREWIDTQVKLKQFVWHLSIHSFTPQLGDDVRQAEIGLLYDPQRKPERELCARWQVALREVFPEFRIRRNYPYLGKLDGHTTTLRKVFSAKKYAGIEIEVNQRLFEQSSRDIRALQRGIARSYQIACSSGSSND